MHHTESLGKSSWAGLVDWGFQLLYHQFAWSYDAVSWTVSRGQWRAWQQVALRYAHGPAVLELGHGPGHLLPILTQGRFETVVAIDRSAEMGRLAMSRSGRGPDAAILVRANVEQLPFGDNLFDTVLSTFPTAYIAQSNTLQEVARTMKPGGRLVIIPGARLVGKDLINQAISGLFRLTGQQSENLADDASHWAGELVERAGGAFEWSAHIERLESSEVAVVIGRKQTAV